jgi:hypothetical protein
MAPSAPSTKRSGRLGVSGTSRSSRSTSASLSTTAVAPTASVCRRTVGALSAMPVSSSSQKAARAKGNSAPSRTSHPCTRPL